MRDKIVPVATGIATARAAGLLELSQPDPDYGVPIDRVLIKSGAVEGLDRLNRYAYPDLGPRAALGGHILCGENCGASINLDPTGYSCDEQGAGCLDETGGPRLSPPLRAQVMRQTSAGVSALSMPYLDPHGRHAVHPPEPSRSFDTDQFMLNLIGRYFESQGREIHFEHCQSKMAEFPWIPPVPN